MRRVHFIGVSGIGMSAAAEISMSLGMDVSGSALEENAQTKRLQRKGMTFYLGHRAGQVEGSDLVVMSAAVPDENPEVVKARGMGIPVRLYSEYLGMLMENKRGVAVAGTHGKTTTTAMLAAVATKAGLDPTVVCGGVMRQFGSNAVVGRGELFIAEACEYNRSFLDLPKKHAVITNIEPEHLDYYADLDEIRQAFRLFLESTDKGGVSCVNGDDPNVRAAVAGVLDSTPGKDRMRMVSVGYGEGNGYRIRAQKRKGGMYTMHLAKGLEELLCVDLPLPGRFNCINAGLTAAWALEIGIKAPVIIDALRAFRGTQRRLEHLGDVGGVTVYSDYAHHPTEIEGSLLALRETHCRRRIALVFQPHQYARTAHFFGEFVKVLAGADRLVLTEVYRQRDREDAHVSVSGVTLYEALKRVMGEHVVFIEKKEDINPYLQDERANLEVLIFMGAGDIDTVAREFVSQMQFP